MRVLVCGGRDYRDRKTLRDVLDGFHAATPFSSVIHGDAPGADTLAGMWALQHDILVEVYPAEWRRYGRSAGPIRNEKMLREGRPDLVVAFPGGRGTADMVRRAQKAGVRVEKVEPNHAS